MPLFTPGFVAGRNQLQRLADTGVVLLFFEVGTEVDLWRLRLDYGRLIWASPSRTRRRSSSSTRPATYLRASLMTGNRSAE